MSHYLKVYQKFLITDTEIFTCFLLFTLPESGKISVRMQSFFCTICNFRNCQEINEPKKYNCL